MSHREMTPAIPNILYYSFFFFNQVYCAKGTIPRLHIKVTGRSRERMSELSTN